MGKWTAMLASCLTLAACAPGKKGPAASACVPQDPFEANGKVQVSAEAGAPESVDPARFMSAVDMANTLTGTGIVRRGQLLSAVIKLRCEEPGEISGAVNFGNLPSNPAGVQSVGWVVPRDMSESELKSAAAKDECVVGLSDANLSYTNALPGDPLVREQKHLSFLQASAGYDVFYEAAKGVKKQVVIALVDTGIDLEHEDLKQNLWVNGGEIASNGVDDDKNGYVDDVHGYNFASGIGSPQYQGAWGGNYHGTHVAGLAAGRASNRRGGTGVMGLNARIMMLNVFGEKPAAYSYNIENAIRYAADNGADVINLSLGGPGRLASYEAALAYAIKKGVTVLAAAGNEAKELNEENFMAPASYAPGLPGMMAVASVDANSGDLSSFSNHSPDVVEIAAPGSEDSVNYVGVLSSLPGGQYGRFQGTSMSAPVAAGAAGLAIGLLRSRGYETAPSLIERVMTAGARTYAALATRIKQGRVLNLKAMADYINRHFPGGGVYNDVGDADGPVNASRTGVPCT